MEIKKISHEEWLILGTKLYGENMMDWKWKCPMCHYVATGHDYKSVGASPGSVGFSCIGRWMKNPKTLFDKNRKGNGPCDYAGGGLFRFNPIHVQDEKGEIHEVFEFADIDMN